MSYSIYGPFTDGGSPPVNQTFLNNLETFLATVKSHFYITPYHIMNSVSFSSNQTQTFTATGVGGIPGGAAAIIVGGNLTSATIGVYAQFAPNSGGTLGQYFEFGNVPTSSGFVNGSGTLPLDNSGAFKVKVNNAAGTVDLWIYGYVA